MKWMDWVVLVLILLPFIGCEMPARQSLQTPSAMASRFLKNPGFEEGGGGVDGANPGVGRYWQNTDGKSHPGWYEIDEQVAHSGKRSQRLTYIPGTSDPWGTVWQFTPEGSITPGKRYKASVWCKTENITGASEKWGWLHLAIRWFGPGQKMLGEEIKAERIEPINHDWTKAELSGTAPPGTSYIQMNLYLHTEAGTYWYDDAEITEE